MQAAPNFSGIHLFQIPYDSGRRNFRMGNGPAHLNQALADLAAVSSEEVTVEERPFELGTTFRILRAVSDKVRESMADNRLPILLAGGCLSSLGSLSAIGSDSTALIWFDAHADFNTPETTPSGFIDGMALAAITGRCWRNLAASVPGFRPMHEKNIALIGARDLDSEERTSLERSQITYLRPESIRKNRIEDCLSEVLARLPKRVYVHVDLDVLDRAEACVNEYSSPGGLTVSELLHIIGFIGHNR
ncbi:MAG TPA: arginase family protein, partial [Candidatus Sulfotelmatobacter sp.]|nr:arginase family protein [Candidatus Sulfotelmatobacter sp.]